MYDKGLRMPKIDAAPIYYETVTFNPCMWYRSNFPLLIFAGSPLEFTECSLSKCRQMKAYFLELYSNSLSVSFWFQDAKASSNDLFEETWPTNAGEAKTVQWISTTETSVNTAG